MKPFKYFILKFKLFIKAIPIDPPGSGVISPRPSGLNLSAELEISIESVNQASC